VIAIKIFFPTEERDLDEFAIDALLTVLQERLVYTHPVFCKREKFKIGRCV